MFIVSVIVQTNCHILRILHQTFNLSALLLDDALKPATPLTNGAINETLRQFAPLCLLQLVDWRESLTLIDHLLKGTQNSVIDKVRRF